MFNVDEPERRKDTGELWLDVVVALIVLGLGVYGAWGGFENAIFNRHSADTIGELRELRDCRGAVDTQYTHSPASCYVSLSYRHPGRGTPVVYEGRLNVAKDDIEHLGRSGVRVYYDTRNPYSFTLARRGTWVNAFFVGLLVAASVGIARKPVKELLRRRRLNR